jgi:hypothetical protein
MAWHDPLSFRHFLEFLSFLSVKVMASLSRGSLSLSMVMLRSSCSAVILDGNQDETVQRRMDQSYRDQAESLSHS